jgi:LysR substrate binding domain
MFRLRLRRLHDPQGGGQQPTRVRHGKRCRDRSSEKAERRHCADEAWSRRNARGQRRGIYREERRPSLLLRIEFRNEWPWLFETLGLWVIGCRANGYIVAGLRSPQHSPLIVEVWMPSLVTSDVGAGRKRHRASHEARRLLRQAENAVESARRTHNGQSGRLVIGFHSSAMLEVLPKILRKYCRLYPDVMVELSEMLGIRDSELVLDSPLSVALLRSPSFLNEKSFCIETILREPFVVAVPDSHPAAKQDSVRIKSLADEPFILHPRQPGWDY